MWAASDIADWWDKQHADAKKELDHFVDSNPNLFGVIVATAVATAMEVGKGTVDLLRFGEGAAEGGLAGFGKDTIRLIGLMGPLGKAGKFAQVGINARLARLIVDPGGKICGWVSGAQALRQTGARAFVAIEDLAQAMGKTLSELGGSQLAQRINVFRGLGARISGLRKVSTLEDIAAMTKNDGGVTMFNIFGKRMEGGALKSIGHAVYAFRDLAGKLKILDRGGAGKGAQIFSSMEELAKRYGLSGSWAFKEAAVMENLFAKFMGSISSAPVFAVAAYASTTAPPEQNKTVAQAFEVHKTVMRQGKKGLETQGARYHIVVSGDWLSRLAKTYYGDMFKWPIIFEANRDVIGDNPNLIEPKQKLLIPELPKI